MIRIELMVDGKWVAALDPENGVCEVSEARQKEAANSISTIDGSFLPDSPLSAAAVNARIRAYDDIKGKWVFYGRIIETEPSMDSDGTLSVRFAAEDALGFLQDTRVWIDSRKAYFEDQNKSYWVEIGDDETRTIRSADLVKLIVGQHDNTVGDSHGDEWKKVTFDDLGIDADEQTSFEAEYEATTYEMLADIAEDSDLEYRSRYDGSEVHVEVADSLGRERGTFAVGDNLASSALKTSMADVVTRMFPYGDEYAVLEKKVRKGTKVAGALKGSEWQTKKGTMVRFDVEGSLKCVLTVGARDKDYAMVFFTDRKITAKNYDDAVLKKYTTKAKATGDNLVRRYPVPEDAKYCYVYGADSKCTTYGYYTNAQGAYIKRHYRTDLAFWKKKLTDKQLSRILKKYGCEMGSVVDGSGDRSYFLRRNEGKYGVVEGTCIKEKQLATSKITNPKKAVYSIDDLKATRAKAERFVKYACRQLKRSCSESVSITVSGYDLAEAGLDYDAIELYNTCTVVNELSAMNHKVEIVSIERNLLDPWEVDVELGSKVTRASSSNRANSLYGGAASPEGDDDDSAEDEYAALAGQYSAAAESAAKEAVEKADELDAVSYRIQVDSLAAGQMASEAYDSVHPITEAMRGALEDAEEQANQLTAVKESQSQTIQTSSSLARAVATYSYETEKSVVRWRQTYTASLDAWASEDPEVQDKIKAAYAKLYGEGGTADEPTADSAQGHLNAAKAANVEATATEAEMRAELASANAYQASCTTAASKAQAAYEKALANYKAVKKRTTAKRKQVDAAHTALNAAEAKRDKSQAAVDSANERCAEAETNYSAATEALADAEAKVTAAQSEVDTAMNGIHELYSSTIEQTAKSIEMSAQEIETAKDGSETLKQGIMRITADVIKSIVISGKDGTQVTQTATGWEVSSTDTAKGHMSYDPTTNTLTLGGASTSSVVLGGSGALVCTSLTIGPSTVSSIDDLKGEKGDKGDKGATGATGPQGEQGPQGPQGPAGTDVTSQYVVYKSTGSSAGINVTYKQNDVSGYHSNMSASGLKMMNGDVVIASFTTDENDAILTLPDGYISANKSPVSYIDRPMVIGKAGGSHIYIYKSKTSGISTDGAAFDCGDMTCSNIYANKISCTRLDNNTIVRDSGTTSFAVNTSSNTYNVGLRAYASSGNPSRHGLYTGSGSGTDFEKWMVYADGSGGTTVNTSSSRFCKENIRALSDEMARRLLDAEAVCFDYRLGEGEEDYSGRKGWVGFIAEDMYGIVPGAVTCRDEYDDLEARIAAGEDTSGLGIDYITFVPYLVKLCQMQQEQIDTLAARVAALECDGS